MTTAASSELIYLDHAATTPMRPEAVDAMLPFLSERFANPSGSHRFARTIRQVIDESRDVLRAYGVWHKLGLDAWNIARPALFLIDRGGAIRYSFVSNRQDEFPSHDEIVREIDRL